MATRAKGKKPAAGPEQAQVRLPITAAQARMIADAEREVHVARDKLTAIYGAVLAGIDGAPKGRVEGLIAQPPQIVITPAPGQGTG